jgi:transcriptional regulator GlxA family with amidase domain
MTFGFLAFHGLEELDLIGPWEMAGMWRRLGGPEAVIVAERLEPVVCTNGLSLNPHVDFEQCPPLDYLLIPGGEGTRREVDNEAAIGFIANQAHHCRAILSVCTGAFLLHRAGLLAGRAATTHWRSLDRLRSLENVRVLEERFVKDGNVWTAAGVSAGIDLILAFIADVAGEDVAGKVQFGAEYYPSSRRFGRAYLSEKAPGYLV